MDWSAKEENGSTIIYIKESLSISKLVPLKEFLLDKMKGTQPILVNLSEVRSCDAAGIQFLVAVAKMAKMQKLSFEYDGMSLAVVEAAENIGFSFSGL